MATRLQEIVIGETDPPPPPPQQRSSSASHVKLTKKQEAAISAFGDSLLTSVFFYTAAFVVIVFIPNRLLNCDIISFSVESISVSSLSSAAAIWHVGFLVKHPSSRCHVNHVSYDEDGAYAKLGFSKNAAVLKTSHTRLSRGHTSLSVDLATEGNQTDAPRVFEVDLKLSARKKVRFEGGDDYGHFYITCLNLTLGCDKTHECQSSFRKLKELNSSIPLKHDHSPFNEFFTFPKIPLLL